MRRNTIFMSLIFITPKSCDNSGTMWWSIIIHEQKVGGVLAELGDDDGFYDVSEVRTCSD